MESAAGRREWVERGWLVSSTAALPSLECLTLHPYWSTGRAVGRPKENHHQKGHLRSHKPPPECCFDQNPAQPIVGGAENVSTGRFNAGKAVGEDEYINEACDDREPGAAGLTRDEPLPEVEDAANPEKLAGDTDQEQGED